MTSVGSSLLTNVPGLLAWIFGIVLGIVMVRQGGGKAEKLLLTGCSLMFASELASPLLSGFVTWLMSENGVSNIVRAETMGLARLPLAILSLAGLVCLVWAFWMRFRKEKRRAA